MRHTLPLDRSELDKYPYASALEQIRVHGEDFWNGNLYTTWLSALRALSPRASEVMDPGAVGLPKVTSTEAPWTLAAVRAPTPAPRPRITYEVTTTDFKRLNDLEWRARFASENPPAPSWTSSVVSAAH